MEKMSLKAVAIFYSVLMIASMIWITLRGDNTWFVHPDYSGPTDAVWMLRGVGLGLATSLFVVIFSRLISHYFEWARALEREFAKMLGPLSWMQVLGLALFSGVGEEMFFRGAMQPSLGIYATTIIFGLCHIGPSRTYIPWTLMALVLGGVLGWYFDKTGALIAPMTSHIFINLINLSFIRFGQQKAALSP